VPIEDRDISLAGICKNELDDDNDDKFDFEMVLGVFIIIVAIMLILITGCCFCK